MGSETEPFDVNSWMDEAVGGPSSAGAGDDIQSADELFEDIKAAANRGEAENVIHLGQAYLTMADASEHKHARTIMGRAASRLVDQYTPEHLDTAQSWAAVWASFSTRDQAQTIDRDLRKRIGLVRQREAVIAGCIQTGPLANLVMALHEIHSSPDRCQGTATVISQAEAALQHREGALHQAKQTLQQMGGTDLSRSVELMTLIFNEEPDRTHQEELGSLNNRLSIVNQKLAAAEAACKTRVLPSVDQALAALQDSTDRVQGVDAALSRLQALQQELASNVADRLDDYSAFVKQGDLGKAIRALKDIKDLDPRRPEVTKLPELIKRRTKLTGMQEELHDVLDSADRDTIDRLTCKLESEKLKLSATSALITQARDRIDEIDSAIAGQRRSTIMAVIILLLVIGTPTAWYMWERNNFNQASAMTDPITRREALQTYIDTPYFYLFKKQAATLIANDIDEGLEAELQEALAVASLDQRANALQAFIDRHQDNGDARRHLIAARKAAEETITAIDREAYLTAGDTGLPPAAQISRLEGYLQRDGIAYETEARQRIAVLRTRMDEEAWTAAQAPGAKRARIARLEAYLAGATLKAHADEATKLITSLQHQQQSDDSRQADEDAWQAVLSTDDPHERLTAVTAYLQRDAIGHKPEAVHLQKTLTTDLDNSAWQAATGTTDTAARISAIEAYRDSGKAQRSTDEIDKALLLARHAHDDARWNIAKAPGTPEQRRQRLLAYLQEPHVRYHDEDCRRALQSIDRSADFAAFDRARSVANAALRCLALDAYLAADTPRYHAKDATMALKKALTEVAAWDTAELVGLPVEILNRMPASTLGRLPVTLYSKLTERTLQRVPTAAFERCRDKHLQDLPRAIRLRAAYFPSWAKRSGVDERGSWADLAISRSLTIRFRRVPAGTAGGTTLTSPSWLSEQELGQALFEELVGRRKNPSITKNPDLPVHNVGPETLTKVLEQIRRRCRRTPGAEAIRLPSVAELTIAAFADDDDPAAFTPATTSVTPINRGDTDNAPRHGIAYLLGNVAEWAMTEDGPRLFGGPFPVETTELVLPATGGNSHAGIRLAIPSASDEAIRPPVKK